MYGCKPPISWPPSSPVDFRIQSFISDIPVSSLWMAFTSKQVLHKINSSTRNAKCVVFLTRTTLLFVLTVSLLGSCNTQSNSGKTREMDNFVSGKFRSFGNETFGYVRPGQYIRRGHMILQELYNLYGASIEEKSILVADWGSNFGWFSTFLAYSFPQSYVISFEGDPVSQKRHYTGIPFHMQYLRGRNIKNNQICRTFFSRKTFHALKKLGVTFDVQLVLSVMHWNVAWPEHNGTLESYIENICTWVAASRLTFIEAVPEQLCIPGKECYAREGLKVPDLRSTLSHCGLTYELKLVPRPKVNIPHDLVDKKREKRPFFMVHISNLRQTDFKASVVSLQQTQSQELLGCDV